MITREQAHQVTSQIVWGAASLVPHGSAGISITSLSEMHGDYTLNRPDGTFSSLTRAQYLRLMDEFTANRPLPGTVKVHLSDLPFLADWSDLFPGSRVGANLFVSGATISGLKPHYDDHHVFAVQLHGQKEWHLGGVVEVASPEHQGRYPVKSPPILECWTTSVGQTLYMPSGEWHATSTPEQSVHMTIGVYPPTVAAVAREIIRARAQVDPVIRSELPLAARSIDGKRQAQLPGVSELKEIWRRLGQLDTASGSQLAADLQLTLPGSTPHERALPKVLGRLEPEIPRAVYGRGSGVAGQHDRAPWDLDFVVICHDEVDTAAMQDRFSDRAPADDDLPPLDVKILTVPQLRGTSDGAIRRLDLLDGGRLLFGTDVVSFMRRPAVDAELLQHYLERTITVARLNLASFSKGKTNDRPRFAKSVLRLGSPYLLRDLCRLERAPLLCAQNLAWNFPEQASEVKLVWRALGTDVPAAEMVLAATTVVEAVESAGFHGHMG